MTTNLLVHVPYYNTDRTLFNRSIRSLIKQSYGRYEILITTDGCTPTAEQMLGFKHPLVKHFVLEQNHGRYYADVVALLATPYPFYLPSDADDVSSFRRLERLIEVQATSDADMVYHWQRIMPRNGRTGWEMYPLMQRQLGVNMRHLAHWSALYKTEMIKGLILPQYRVAQDTLVVNLIKMMGTTRLVPSYLYARNIVANSLTTAKATGFGSPYRRKVAGELEMLYKKAHKHPSKIRQIMAKAADKKLMAQAHKDAARLKEAMGW